MAAVARARAGGLVLASVVASLALAAHGHDLCGSAAGSWVVNVPNASHITSLDKQQHLQRLSVTALTPSKNKSRHLHEQVNS